MVTSLQYRLMVKDEAMAQCQRDEEMYRKKIEELDKGFNVENDKSLENTGEMLSILVKTLYESLLRTSQTRLDSLRTV